MREIFSKQRLFRTFLFMLPIVMSPVANAVDCWPEPKRQHLAVSGKLAMEVVLQRAGNLLRNDAALNQLPDLRLQIKSFIGYPSGDQSLPVGEVGAHGNHPEVWGKGCSLQQGRADYVSPFNVSIHLNTLDPVFQTLATPSAVESVGWFAPADFTMHARGDRLHGRRVLVLSHPKRPALVPLSVLEYLNFHEKKMMSEIDQLKQVIAIAPGTPTEGLRRLQTELGNLQKYRKQLNPTQLALPAALGRQPEDAASWAIVSQEEKDAVTLFKPNPKLWDGARPGDVRVMTISVWMNNEGDRHQAALEAWIATLDLVPFEALLTK